MCVCMSFYFPRLIERDMDCYDLSSISGMYILFVLDVSLSCEIHLFRLVKLGFNTLSKVTLYECTFESIEYLSVNNIQG